VIDCLFIADMLLNFSTGYYDHNHRVIIHRPKIVRHYLRGWFVVDFCSSVPIDQIVEGVTDIDSKQLRSIKIIRALRLVRLLKMARLLKLVKYISHVQDHLEESANIPPAMFKLFRLIFQIIFIAHFVGCFWY
jgi:hypothetical protein